MNPDDQTSGDADAMTPPHGYTQSESGLSSGGGFHAPNDDLFSGRIATPQEGGGSRFMDDRSSTMPSPQTLIMDGTSPAT